MKILALFNLKKDFELLKSSGKLDDLKDFIEQTIIDFVKKELKGSEKKEEVTTLVIAYIGKIITPINPIIATILNIIAPKLIQYVYDSLVKYVDGLTIK